MKNVFFVAEIRTEATGAREMKTRFDLGNFKSEADAWAAARRDFDARCTADDLESDQMEDLVGHPMRLSDDETYHIADYDRDVVYTVIDVPTEADVKFGIMEEHTTPYGECDLRILPPLYGSREEAEATIKYAEEHEFVPGDYFDGESGIILTKPLGNGRFKCGHHDEDESQWDDFFAYNVVAVLS